jgi:hypothetical protein
MSAIEVAQPPSASADSSSAPNANARFFRSIDIRPEVSASPIQLCLKLTLISSTIAARRSNLCRPKRLIKG